MYYLEHEGSRWIGSSPQNYRELNLKYFRKIFGNNNILVSPGGSRKG